MIPRRNYLQEAALNRNFLYVMAGLVLGVILGIARAEVAKYMSMISSTRPEQ
jgi:hypothetical protein